MAIGMLAAWLLAGASISASLDRFLTVGKTPLPLGQFALDSDQLTIGSRRWWLGSGLRVAQDSHHRVTLSSGSSTFTVGPTIACAFGSAGACFDFVADPGDEITFSKSRSWLAWPTPFQISIMGAARTSWRRHAYYRLLWKKSSGATLELLWRDQQGFYAEVGWTDGNLQVAPLVTITPSPSEAVVVSYLLQKKGWTRDTYLLENMGPSSDGQCDVTSVIHLKDVVAAHPGAGRSIDLCVNQKLRQVTGEVGGQ